MKYWFVFLCFLFTTSVKAEENFPKACKPIIIKGESFIIHAKNPQLILINNRSKNDLWLSHPVSAEGAGAGFTSRMETSNWTAIVVHKKSFDLDCIEAKPGHEQQVACEEVIVACKLPKVKMPEKARGIFWAGENLSLATVIDHLGENGFKW